MCWEAAATLSSAREEFEALGATIRLIGLGSAQGAAEFSELSGFPADLLLVDESRELYEALECASGVRATFFSAASAKAIAKKGWDPIKKAAENFAPIKPVRNGDVLWQGGSFVFRGGKCVYARRDGGTGDHAPIAELLEACRA